MAMISQLLRVGRTSLALDLPAGIKACAFAHALTRGLRRPRSGRRLRRVWEAIADPGVSGAWALSRIAGAAVKSGE
jgi:hypothetical protein